MPIIDNFRFLINSRFVPLGRIASKYYIFAVFALFVIIRLISINDVFLWLDEVDFLGNTYVETVLYNKPLNPPWPILTNPDNTLIGTLGTSVSMGFNASTTPWLPILIDHLIILFWGHHLLLLRLHSLIVSIISFFVLYQIVKKLFSCGDIQLLIMLLYTFSIPLIFYSQSPEPVGYYFLTTAIQILYFLKMIGGQRNNQSRGEIVRSIQIFSRISFILFLFNYMSLLIHVICIGYYVVYIAISNRNNMPLRGYIFYVIEAIIDSVPLGILALIRLLVGDQRVVFEVDNITDFFRLSYQFLTYNFNVAYTTDVYTPKGLNPVTWPFIVLSLIGAGYFFISRKNQRWSLLYSVGVVIACVFLEIMPFGGVRHTLSVVPFLFLFAGYGLLCVYRIFRRLHVPQWIYSLFIGILAGLIIVIFLFSGSNIYRVRKSTLDLDRIISFARVNNVTSIAGYKETSIILGLLNHASGGKLEESGISFQEYSPDLNEGGEGKYLLVAYRHKFDPEFEKYVPWRASFPEEDFAKTKVTPLEEIVGPLKPVPDVMVHQSIYYPVNGSFVYLIEPAMSESGK